MAGLRSLDSVSGSHYYGQLMEKIKAGPSELVSGSEYILIDLSPWYKDSLSPKIELIQSAIEERRGIRFNYYAPNGDSTRELEPYYLFFKWSSWYVWGCKVSSGDLFCTDRSGTERCRLREDYRMFKLTRMGISEDEALNRFKESHKKVMEALDIFSQEELFTSTYYPWVVEGCIGSYFISGTSSHYDWAMKKMKAHKKNVE